VFDLVFIIHALLLSMLNIIKDSNLVAHLALTEHLPTYLELEIGLQNYWAALDIGVTRIIVVFVTIGDAESIYY
jgi:hypothetical protein